MDDLVKNIDGDSHLKRLKSLAPEADSITLVSPFLNRDMGDLLDQFDLPSLAEFRLITTLKPRTTEQLGKADSLHSLLCFFESNLPEVALSVEVDNALHGKIYLFKKAGELSSAIVTSANLTEHGLRLNHEWGIQVSDRSLLLELEKSINSACKYVSLLPKDIRRIKKRADNYRKKHGGGHTTKIDLDLTKSIGKRRRLSRFTNNTFWLKPVGVTEEPLPEGRPFSESRHELAFSQTRPAGIRVGHVIVTYGVGTTKLLSVSVVESLPRYASHAEIEEEGWRERWPWSVESTNLTPKYGSCWWRYNLTLSSLRDEYLSRYPDRPITRVGGQTLGALSFGKDKLNLAEDFALFLVEKVTDIDYTLDDGQSNESA